jgi:RNA polymerase sigma-70 factor (ECF subfamily)
MTDSHDTALIKQAQSGDAKAFETLVGKYYETMFKFAFKYCRHEQNAQDIAQEACIKLARGISSYKHDSAFTSWLYRLVINAAKDYFRSQNRHNVSSDGLELVEASGDAEDQLHAREVLQEVYKLPEGERDALLLVMAEGLSHKEAADVLGCKESTISWRIHEARKKLGAWAEKEQKYG